MTQNLQEISALGMENWFKENLHFELTNWGINGKILDNPIIGIGLHSVWDDVNKRILLTKRELVPTKLFEQWSAYYLHQIEGQPQLSFDENNNYYVQHVVGAGTQGTPPPQLYVNALASVGGIYTLQPVEQSASDAGPNEIPYFVGVDENAPSGWALTNSTTYILYEGVLYRVKKDPFPPHYFYDHFIYASGNGGELAEALLTLPEAFDFSDFSDVAGTPAEVGYVSATAAEIASWTLYAETSELVGTVPISWADPKFFKQEGWTISYYPETNMWGSFHSYVPYKYFGLPSGVLSMYDGYLHKAELDEDPIGNWGIDYLQSAASFESRIWDHRTTISFGHFYGGLLPAENLASEDEDLNSPSTHNPFPSILEFIYNENKIQDSLFSNFSFHVDVINSKRVYEVAPGFTSYIVYTTKQLSAENEILYLPNTRLIGNDWKINAFRDMSALRLYDAANQDTTGHNYITDNLNVVGQISTGSTVPDLDAEQFYYSGMHKDLNLDALDLDKKWNLQKKFIDKWLGIRLICNNIHGKSVNLYSAKVEARKFHR